MHLKSNTHNTRAHQDSNARRYQHAAAEIKQRGSLNLELTALVDIQVSQRRSCSHAGLVVMQVS